MFLKMTSSTFDNAVRTCKVAQQLFLLGSLLTLLALVFHSVLGLFGGTIGRALAKPGRYSRVGDWGLAGVFGLLAARLVIMQRPA